MQNLITSEEFMSQEKDSHEAYLSLVQTPVLHAFFRTLASVQKKHIADAKRGLHHMIGYYSVGKCFLYILCLTVQESKF